MYPGCRCRVTGGLGLVTNDGGVEPNHWWTPPLLDILAAAIIVSNLSVAASVVVEGVKETAVTGGEVLLKIEQY